MNTFNAADLIRTIATIRGEAAASRDTCRKVFTHALHDRLLGILEEATADLYVEVALEEKHAAGKGTPDGDEFYAFYRICTVFEAKWIKNGPVSLLDDIYECDVSNGEPILVGRNYTLVPAWELEGLPALLESIEQRTGIVFVVARV